MDAHLPQQNIQQCYNSGNVTIDLRTQYFRVVFITYYYDWHSERSR